MSDLYKNKFIIITFSLFFIAKLFFSHTDNAKWDHSQHSSTRRYKQELSLVFCFFVKTEAAQHTASSTGLVLIPRMLGAKLFARVQRLDSVGSG